MKKRVFVLIIAILMLSSCSADKSQLNESQTTAPAATDISPEFHTAEATLKRLEYGNFIIMQSLGENYFGNLSEFRDGEGVVYDETLVNIKSAEITPLSYPQSFPEWYFGSGYTAVMQGRYVYEWKSYTSMFEENGFHDVRLTKIDGETGKVEVVDKAEQLTPFTYLCKINDTEFLSYTVMPTVSDKTEYATETAASIYNINGKKREIIREKYENDAEWTNSEGILIERFAVNNGEIYGVGRRRIDGEYKFFMYHYSKNGELIDTKPLENLENIIGEEQFAEIYLNGDYFAFRTYETLSTYVCRINPTGVETIAEGESGSVQYAASGDKIYYIESTVDQNTGEVVKTDCPLYEIDTRNGNMREITFEIPIENPYFVSITALMNGEVILTYCPDGIYDPMKMYQYKVIM